MHDGKHRVAQKHPWPGISHNFPHPFTHIFFIAMNLAFCANRFIFPKNAFVNTYNCILKQFITIIAKISLRMVMALAVKADHTLNRDLFSFNAGSHSKIKGIFIQQ
jgi:hypothetical protein